MTDYTDTLLPPYTQYTKIHKYTKRSKSPRLQLKSVQSKTKNRLKIHWFDYVASRVYFEHLSVTCSATNSLNYNFAHLQLLLSHTYSTSFFHTCIHLLARSPAYNYYLPPGVLLLPLNSRSSSAAPRIRQTCYVTRATTDGLFLT